MQKRYAAVGVCPTDRLFIKIALTADLWLTGAKFYFDKICSAFKIRVAKRPRFFKLYTL